jgi:hypothetical protein
MGYIIVWRPNGRDPHISLDSHYFKEEYSNYDDAVKDAEEMLDDDHYRSYAIFEEVTS